MIKQYIAGITALAYCVTHVVFANASETNLWAQRAEMARRIRGGNVGNASPLFADIPLDEQSVLHAHGGDEKGDWLTLLGKYGTLRDFQARGKGPVLFIQDVHGHRQAQENIGALILSILERFPKAPIVLEGASGSIPVGRFRGKDPTANRGAAGFFFNVGMISGAEYAILGTPKTPTVFGGEDPTLYRKNRDAIDRAAILKPGWDQRLKVWHKELNVLKERIYSQQLKDLDQRSSQWGRGEGLLEQAVFLAETIQLPPPQEGSSLAQFLRIGRMEKTILFDQAERDRNDFLQSLSSRMSVKQNQALIRAALAFRQGRGTPGGFYSQLQSLAETHAVNLARFPSFESYVTYMLWAERLCPESLVAELDAREESLWTVLAQSPMQRNLRALDRDLRLLDGLVQLSLTPAEWTYYKDRRTEIRRMNERAERLRSSLADVPVGSLGRFAEHLLDPSESFYESAEARNDALAQHVVSALADSPPGTPLVLVAGGFHAKGLVPLLIKADVGVMTVAPRLGNSSEFSGAFALFARDKTPLEQLFDSPKISLSETSAFAPLTRDGEARHQALSNLAGPLVDLLEIGETSSEMIVKTAENDLLILAEKSRELSPLLPNASRICDRVPASIEHSQFAPKISIYRLGSTFWQGMWKVVRRSSGRLLAVFLILAALVPMAWSPGAHAYTLTERDGAAYVVVQEGEHLWGAAAHVLKANGNPHPSNETIAKAVEEMARLNKIGDPNLVHPGTAYRVPGITSLDVPPNVETISKPPLAGIHVSAPRFSEDSGTAKNRGAVAPSVDADSNPDKSPRAPQETRPYTSLIFSLFAGALLSIGLPVSLIALSKKKGSYKGIQRLKSSLSAIKSKTLDTPLFRQWVPVAMIALFVLVLAFPGSWLSIFTADGVQALVGYIVAQWPVELALLGGVIGAVYYVWYRPNKTDLAQVTENDIRLREWESVLGEMMGKFSVDEEKLSHLANNVHALVLNNRVTAAALSDRGVLEKHIDLYRALSQLSRKTTFLLDRRLIGNTWSPEEASRIADLREKFFLFQLYGLKVSNALVPASVTHWALSNYDRENSWFEQRKVGFLLRLVRGVPSMIAGSVKECTSRLLLDKNVPPGTLWDQAEHLSVVNLGNILIPGLYSEREKSDLGNVFNQLKGKIKTRQLSDMAAKDLHRKGWGTLTSILIWTVAISQVMSFFPALLGFLTGLGVTMTLFRFQAMGVRRDGFYQEAISLWRDMNRRPHANGRLNGNGKTAGEDPFHLNRDFSRYHFGAAENALRSELESSTPTADIVILVAQNESEKAYFEERAKDPRLFRSDVLVVVLMENRSGSFYAYAQAWSFLYSKDFSRLRNHHSHLRGRTPADLGVITLVSKSGNVQGMGTPLSEIVQFTERIDRKSLGDRNIFDLALMNAYRGTQASRLQHQGGMVLRWSDRAYVGPVRCPKGPGVMLDTQWANQADMARYNFGAVIAYLGRPLELIRRSKKQKTLDYLSKEHVNRVYDFSNDRLKQVQAFSGEGIYVFDRDGAQAQVDFFRKVLGHAEVLSQASSEGAPPLNLMTFFLVPLSLAQKSSKNVGTAINAYFARLGFYNDTLPKEIQAFNLNSANAFANAFARDGKVALFLNAAFSDESIYAATQGAEEIEEPPTLSSEPAGLEPDRRVPRWEGFRHTLAVLVLLFGNLASPLSSTYSHPTMDLSPEISVRGTASLQSIQRALQGRTPDPVRDQKLAQLLVWATADIPLEKNATAAFDPAWVRKMVQTGTPRLVRGPRKWRGGQNSPAFVEDLSWPTEFFELTDKKNPLSVSEVLVGGLAQRALARQLEFAWETHRAGRVPQQELHQAAYLQGIAGRSWAGKEEALGFQKSLEDLMGVDGSQTSLNAWKEGSKFLANLRTRMRQTLVRPPKTTVTAIRVNELVEPGYKNESHLRALVAKLETRIRRFDPQQGDILIINGLPGLDISQAKDLLRYRLPPSPDRDSYFKCSRVVMIEEPTFAPTQVWDGLSEAEKNGRSLDLYTVNPEAIWMDPQAKGDHRVLLLEWVSGTLQSIDLLDLARQAIKATRVIRSNA